MHHGFDQSCRENRLGNLPGIAHSGQPVMGHPEGIVRATQKLGPARQFLRQKLTADDHALVADVDSRAGDELGDLRGGFAAERAATRTLEFAWFIRVVWRILVY